MGRYTENGIDKFSPDDTDTEFYLDVSYRSYGFLEIIEEINKRWPGVAPSDLSIDAKYIHTNCLGYDSYDPSDYTPYIVVTRNA